MPDALLSPDLLTAPRVVIEADLRPLIGSRIQPTGFPNLGAAEFTGPDGERFLLVESAQSIANRLEAVVWDDAAGDLVEPLRGLPYVRTSVDGRETDSVREAHRLNSPYLHALWPDLAKRADIAMAKKKAAGKPKKGAAPVEDADGAEADGEEGAGSSVDRRKLAKAVFYYDPSAVLHGVFLEKITGLARLTRVVSGFIEASGVSIVASGGVKNDRLDPTGKVYEIDRDGSGSKKGGAAVGFGNVPYSRSEYTAKRIVASFAIDTALLRSYGLGEDAERLLLAIALWKIRTFLTAGLRLRTACDLEVEGEPRLVRPADATLPPAAELEAAIGESIRRCADAGLFASPSTTVVPF